MVPVVKHVCDGPEAPGCHTTRTCVTAIHCPKHEVALIWIQLQQQHHCLTTQLVHLEEIIVITLKWSCSPETWIV